MPIAGPVCSSGLRVDLPPGIRLLTIYFMSMLGTLTLIGLLIKNTIVLIGEIDRQIDEGKE